MIRLTRINHVPVVLNSDLIEHVEATPDTVITLTTGRKFVVLESPEEVIRRVIEFRRSIRTGRRRLAAGLQPEPGVHGEETASHGSQQE